MFPSAPLNIPTKLYNKPFKKIFIIILSRLFTTKMKFSVCSQIISTIIQHVVTVSLLFNFNLLSFESNKVWFLIFCVVVMAVTATFGQTGDGDIAPTVTRKASAKKKTLRFGSNKRANRPTVSRLCRRQPSTGKFEVPIPFYKYKFISSIKFMVCIAKPTKKRRVSSSIHRHSWRP